jgi:hypothetical protein
MYVVFENKNKSSLKCGERKAKKIEKIMLKSIKIIECSF